MHYVVQKKEKISDIMNKFDIPYDAIKYYNSFVQTEEDIHEGRVLTFPLKYMVLPGDTYQLITQKKLLLTSTELALLNPEIHEHSILYPGQTILFPPFGYRLANVRQQAEEKIVTQFKQKEHYEEMSEPVFTTEAGFVTLTFDDGPSVHTERILEILEKKDARAIFFMVGENVARFPAAARKVAEAGHVIGNHSYTHPFFTKLSNEKQEEELKKTSDLIADVTGIGPRYFRPPYGSYNESTLHLVLRDNMKVVMWSADPKDYSFNTANSVIGAAEPILSSRKILLLHDLKKATVDALPQIIDLIREKKLSITKEFEK